MFLYFRANFLFELISSFSIYPNAISYKWNYFNLLIKLDKCLGFRQQSRCKYEVNVKVERLKSNKPLAHVAFSMHDLCTR